MRYYRATKKVKVGQEKKVWAYIVEIDENRKQVFNEVDYNQMVINIAWTKFQNFSKKENLDISKEKKSFEIEYLGDDREKILESWGIDPATGELKEK